MPNAFEMKYAALKGLGSSNL